MMRHRRDSLWAAAKDAAMWGIAVLPFLLLAPGADAQMFGTWKVNPVLSTPSGAGIWTGCQSVLLEPHPEGERVTLRRVALNGHGETEMYVLRIDGKDHIYDLSNHFDTILARKLPDGTVEELAKKNGQVVMTGRRRLSAGGTKLIQEYRWMSTPARIATLVLERVEGAGR